MSWLSFLNPIASLGSTYLEGKNQVAKAKSANFKLIKASFHNATFAKAHFVEAKFAQAKFASS